MELITEFTVWGQPKPKERPRKGRGGHFYTPRETVNQERAVLDAFELACPLWEPSIEFVRLEVDVYFEGAAKSDGGNVYKLVEDALNKRAYKDDRQVRQGVFEWFDHAGDQARTVTRFYILDESDITGDRP